jgi:hypothetical protein
VASVRVVVVAGRSLDAAASALAGRGATVAFVADTAVRNGDVAVHFRTDPSDAGAWDRIAMHVEQHLGPIDAVVADAAAAPVVEAGLGADLARRGRSGVVVVNDADDAVSQVLGTP